MNDVRAWLESLGLGEYAQAFDTNRIDADVLPHLTEQDLADLGLPIGPRRKILVAIRSRAEKPTGPTQGEPAGSLPRSAERRHITVMFCDLVGSTALSEALDAEDLRIVMRTYQQAAGAVIERYGGHVAQYLGDGLLTYFGWPAAHEDDAERAVRAALEIVSKVNALAFPTPLQVRIGIASGPVVVGEIGAGDAAASKLAVGETPNLAARIQGLAGAGELVISASTRRLVGATFELFDLGAHSLKGIAEPVQVWGVSRIAPTEGRFEAMRGARLTPFVGRDPELALLLDRWEQAKDREGQVVLLSGEPGIGKSRLTQVLRERVSDDLHTLLRYQCSPYHTSSALYPVIDQLQRLAGLDPTDRAQTKLDKMETLLHSRGDDVPAVGSLFAALLSIDAAGRYTPWQLTPQAQKEATLKALVGQVLARAEQQPVLMIFEDAHWIDPTTQEFLDLLLPAIASERVLAVITHRPEYQPPWARLAQVTSLALARLRRSQAVLMTENVSGGKLLPKEVLDQIILKTDGVPLFVEELTKTVLESGLVTEVDGVYRLAAPLPGLSIPSTLQDSLMARLDRAAPMREVAQVGACIGRQFSREVLAAVSSLDPDALDGALQELLDAELIFRTGVPPNATYTFKHALVQDAAYNSLLKLERQTIHGRIAETLRSGVSAVAESAPETLAYHYMHAALYEMAAVYWRLAAERASIRFANAEAIAHARNGLAALARTPQSAERVASELALRMSLVASLRIGDHHDEALAELQRAQELATEHHRVLALSRIHHARGNIYFPLGQVERCFAEHQAALRFASLAHSTEDEARALGGICDAHYVGGRLLQAHDYADRCLTLCRERGLEAIEVAYLPMRAAIHMYCLRFEQALDDCRSVVALAARVGQSRAEIVSRSTSCWVLLEQQEFAMAEEHASRGVDVAQRIGARRLIPAFSDSLARLRLHAGDRAGAVELLESAWAISRETGVTQLGPIVLGALALATPDPARRREALREGQALLERGCVSHNYFWFYRYAIDVSLAEGDWDAADTYARSLEHYFHAEPMPWSDFIIARGQALAGLGRRGPQKQIISELRRVRDDAAALGLKTELERLDTVLESASAT
ncbi:MAG TPA: adenylate/guanylate cyclase domain-containing protein [Steroidobacteraceae bacterium]|nr:adenylate/guanylate cyclase domain-containing protein [Steroidobacteraceae bacterium]